MTPSSSSLSALLLSDDAHAANISTKMLESHGFSVSKTDSALLARELCQGKRFDLAVYDQDTAGASDLPLFAAPHVALGLVGRRDSSQLFGKRVHFVVQKPFTNDLFGKTLKAAYGVIASSRRRSFRHEVCIDTISTSIVHGRERRNLKSATIINVSRTGMCLQTQEILPQEADLQVSFALPAGGLVVQATGTVIWGHANGRAGIKLNDFSSKGQERYTDWLASMSPNFDGMFARVHFSDRINRGARA